MAGTFSVTITPLPSGIECRSSKNISAGIVQVSSTEIQHKSGLSDRFLRVSVMASETCKIRMEKDS
jgi:hypothetical protein